jgi:hypothetical protein
VKQLALEKGSSSKTDGSSWKDGDKQEAVAGTQALSHTHNTNKQTNNKSLNETLELREDDLAYMATTTEIKLLFSAY